jgi:hypothetical protein
MLTPIEIGPPAAARSVGACEETISRTTSPRPTMSPPLLGGGDEQVRRHERTVATPADQGLDAQDRVRLQVDHRLVEHLELLGSMVARSVSTSSMRCSRSSPKASR